MAERKRYLICLFLHIANKRWKTVTGIFLINVVNWNVYVKAVLAKLGSRDKIKFVFTSKVTRTGGKEEGTVERKLGYHAPRVTRVIFTWEPKEGQVAGPGQEWAWRSRCRECGRWGRHGLWSAPQRRSPHIWTLRHLTRVRLWHIQRNILSAKEIPSRIQLTISWRELKTKIKIFVE